MTGCRIEPAFQLGVFAAVTLELFQAVSDNASRREQEALAEQRRAQREEAEANGGGGKKKNGAAAAAAGDDGKAEKKGRRNTDCLGALLLCARLFFHPCVSCFGDATMQIGVRSTSPTQS